MVNKMHAGALGLTAVIDDRLRTLLRSLYRESLPCPLTIAGLTTHGLQDAAGPLLNHLRGLELPAVRAVVVAVMAEREMAAKERNALLEHLAAGGEAPAPTVDNTD
ncbi:MAG: hypothetical protein JKY37_08590 [Nannocystaceae bacterium]|nr:hypothetical protein [Nannocystaceae bacterium]